MSPLRWDVLVVGFVLALPVLALGLRGDFTAEEVTVRLPWCLLAGWAAVALLHAATAPRKPARKLAPRRPERPVTEDEPAL
jgi:hypothetical protein